MKNENEITCLIDLKLEELENLLKENNFKLESKGNMYDIFYYKEENEDKYELLNNCILIRNLKLDNNINNKTITIKKKIYDKNHDIIDQTKIDCKIESIEEGSELLESLGYKQLMTISDDLYYYSNCEDELLVQCVDDKIYIEIEPECHYINKKYKDLEEIKHVFTKYNIKIKNNDYFAKKALEKLKSLH